MKRWMVLSLVVFAGCDGDFSWLYDDVEGEDEWSNAARQPFAPVQDSPLIEGSGLEHVGGWWALDCPSGVEITPSGEKVTIGASYTVATIDVVTDEAVDWGFDDHEFVSGSFEGVDGGTNVLVTTGYYSGGSASMLRIADGEHHRTDLHEDRYVVHATLDNQTVHSLTATDSGGTDCRVERPSGAVSVADAVCHETRAMAASSAAVFFGLDATTLAVLPDQTLTLQGGAHDLLYAPESDIVAASDETSVRTWKSDGTPLWSMPTGYSQVGLLRDDILLVLEDESGYYVSSRLHFLDISTGQPVRDSVAFDGIAEQVAGAKDADRIVVIVGFEAHVYDVDL